MISIRVSLLSAVIALSATPLFGTGLTKCASVHRDMGRLCPSVAFASSPTPCSMLAEKAAENNEQAPRVFMAVVNDSKTSAQASVKTYADALLIGELQEALSNVRQISQDQKWEEKASIKVAYIAKAMEVLDYAQHSKNGEVQSLCVSLAKDCDDVLVCRLREVLSCLGRIINDPQWHGTTALNEQYVLAAMDYANFAKQSSCLLIRWLAKNIAKNCAYIVPNVVQGQDGFDVSQDLIGADVDTDTDVDDEVASLSSPDSSDDDEVLDREDAMLASLRKAVKAQVDGRTRCFVQ